MNASARHIPALARWYAQLELKPKVLLAELSPSPQQTVHPIDYGQMQGLSRVCNPAIDPAYYFLDGKRVRLIYLEDPTLLAQLSVAMLEEKLGKPTADQALPSTAAKRAVHYVYATDGIAYSVEDGELVFVELFPPMRLEEYLAHIYLKPGPWPL